MLGGGPRRPTVGQVDEALRSDLAALRASTAGRRRAESLAQPDVTALLDALARDLGVHRTAEVGLAHGASALVLCRALRDTGGVRHTAVDPCQSSLFDGHGVQAVTEAGFGDLLRLLEEPSWSGLPRLVAEDGPGSHDLVFVDGSHLYDHVLLDVFYSDLLLRPGGVVVLDDLWMPSVRRVVSFVLRNRAYSVVAAPVDSTDPPLRRLGRAGRRLTGRPRTLWRHPLNAVALRKDADDGRRWSFHRNF